MDYETLFNQVKKASKSLIGLTDDQIDAILRQTADRLEAASADIIAANRQDLEKLSSDDPRYDRLLLDEARISAIAADTRNVAALDAPSGKTLARKTLENGLKLEKITVPFGVIGVIYEARPNVTCDVFALCLKSRNACVLKGGSDAEHSNSALIKVIREVLSGQGVDPAAATLLPSSREAASELLQAVGQVDLIIPRGSARLIQYVRENAKVPVIETGAGICHIYFDEFGDEEIAPRIIDNAKTRRVSVCNALDCLLVHGKRIDVLPALCSLLADKNVTIHADSRAYAVLEGNYPVHLLKRSTPESYGTEFLSYQMAVRTVDSFDEALGHIDRYSSKHSEAIISNDRENAERFVREVDAACVYVNTPTSFTDGAQFGLGAEIGISTQKLHARGPMALAELNTYKWVIRGHGQIRE